MKVNQVLNLVENEFKIACEDSGEQFFELRHSQTDVQPSQYFGVIERLMVSGLQSRFDNKVTVYLEHVVNYGFKVQFIYGKYDYKVEVSGTMAELVGGADIGIEMNIHLQIFHREVIEQ